MYGIVDQPAWPLAKIGRAIVVTRVAELLELLDDGERVVRHHPPNVPEVKPAIAVEPRRGVERGDVSVVVAHVVGRDPTHVRDVDGFQADYRSWSAKKCLKRA